MDIYKDYLEATIDDTIRVVCDFHKKHPNNILSFEICNCKTEWRRRKATPEERKTNRINRLKEEIPEIEDRLNSLKRELETLNVS